MIMASIDFDVIDYISELTDNELLRECNDRGIRNDSEDTIDFLIEEKTNLTAKHITLQMSSNLEMLFDKLSKIDQNEFENFLNKY